MNYFILEERDRKTLELKVLEAMHNGATPIGGVSAVLNRHDTYYMQALMTDPDSKKEAPAPKVEKIKIGIPSELPRFEDSVEKQVLVHALYKAATDYRYLLEQQSEKKPCDIEAFLVENWVHRAEDESYDPSKGIPREEIVSYKLRNEFLRLDIYEAWSVLIKLAVEHCSIEKPNKNRNELVEDACYLIKQMLENRKDVTEIPIEFKKEAKNGSI